MDEFIDSRPGGWWRLVASELGMSKASVSRPLIGQKTLILGSHWLIPTWFTLKFWLLTILTNCYNPNNKFIMMVQVAQQSWFFREKNERRGLLIVLSLKMSKLARVFSLIVENQFAFFMGLKLTIDQINVQLHQNLNDL